MSFHDVLTIIGCIVSFILGIGFNEVYHLRKGSKEDKVLEFEKATYQDLARTLADANSILVNKNLLAEGLVKSYESQNAALNAEIQRQYNEIAALKSNLNTDIPTLDRNSCTLPTGLTIVRSWAKPGRLEWNDIINKYRYQFVTSWSNRVNYALICNLLTFHGFTHRANGDMTREATGCSFSFECLSKYNSVEAFQKDWPYK